jgi:RNA polymerase sigma factor (sigma-70 family)
VDADDSAVLPAGVGEFFRQHYRGLIRTTMYVGATKEEAQDAVAEAFACAIPRWKTIREPMRYLSRAAIHAFLKEKERGLHRVRKRMLVKGAGTAQEGAPETALWEDAQWVEQLLASLPPKQREVMALVVGGCTPTEIGELLGRTAEAVRQNLREARKRLRRTLEQETYLGSRPKRAGSYPEGRPDEYP